MRNRLTTRGSLLRVCLGILFTLLLAWGGSAAMAAEQPAGAPRQPQGAPDSQFVQDMQELFTDAQQPAAAAQTAPITGSTGDSRKMVVRGIAVVPDPVYVWTDQESYWPGDEAAVYVRIPRAAYVYVLDVDTSGDIRIIYPNRYSRNPYISKPGTVSLPNGNYSFTVTEPGGTEYLVLVASSESIGFFDSIANRGGEFPLVDDPGDVIRQLRTWVRNTTRWSAFAWNSFEVQGRSKPVPPVPTKPPVVRNQPPVARIQTSATRVTSGATITFNSNGTNDPDGSIRSYTWDLNGDGRSDATGSSARGTFSTPGTYTVRLTVEDNKGATASATVQVVVEAPKTMLEITSNAKDQPIYVDGSYVGRNTVRMSVSPGSHNVQVNGPNNQAFTTVVNVVSGMKNLKLDVSF